MTYGYGRGFGFRGGSPAWPYVGRGRGGLPRCWSPDLPRFPFHGNMPSSREEQIGFLKTQADILRHQVEDIEDRIESLHEEEAESKGEQQTTGWE